VRSKLLMIATLVFCATPAVAAPSRLPARLSYVPGELLAIEAVPAGTAAREVLARPAVQNVFERYSLETIEPISPARSGPGTLRVWRMRSTLPGIDPRQAAAELRATGAFVAVCPNYVLPLLTTIPDDPFALLQWYIDDGGVADVHLPLAWDTERGDTSTVIAIMDTGIDMTHPDLASQIWQNPLEVANGLDDDGNGLIDDLHGWDFGTGDADPSPEATPDPSGIDVGFHGTFAAGIASAATDNGDGIAGAGWKCRLMPLKVSHPDTGITTSAVTEAFFYAAAKHVGVLSMSFGAPGDPGVPEYFQALIDMATSAGVLCVASAGNEGDSTRVYPAACDHVLSVAATDESNARASFSNWGPWVDVAAPGSLMWSTIAQNYEVDALSQLFYILLFGWDGTNPYMYGDGTSFSAPLVAGVCGLVRTRFPQLGPDAVAAHIVATGDAVAYDLPIGPRLNANQAVTTVPVGVGRPSLPMAFRLSPAEPNPFTGSTRLTFTLPEAAAVRLVIYDMQGRRVRSLVDGARPAGRQSATWDGRDDGGRRARSGVYFARIEAGSRSSGTKLVLLDR
jgi:subtilisin family serine protease